MTESDRTEERRDRGKRPATDQSSGSPDGFFVGAHIEESEDGPDECTMFPQNAEGMDLMSTWITAQGDAFVDLESMR